MEEPRGPAGPSGATTCGAPTAPALRTRIRWRLLGLGLAALVFLNAPAASASALSTLPVGATIRYRSSPLHAYQPIAAPVSAVGRTLILADTPESVRRPGLLYRAQVEGPFRVFTYALNASRGALFFTVVASNPSPYPVEVEVTRSGLGGPSSHYFGVGAMAQVHYFASTRLRLITIPPKGSVFLDPAMGARPSHPGQLVNAVIDASAVSGPLWISVVAERHVTTDLHGMNLLPPGRGPLMRGTFPNGDFDVSAAITGGRRYVLVGDNPRYLHGYSWVDKRLTTDYGNYGVLYNLRFYETAARSGRLTVLFAGKGSSYEGLALLSQDGLGQPVALRKSWGGALKPDEAVVLAHRTLQVGTTAFVNLQWMPAGASTLPAAFLLNG